MKACLHSSKAVRIFLNLTNFLTKNFKFPIRRRFEIFIKNFPYKTCFDNRHIVACSIRSATMMLEGFRMLIWNRVVGCHEVNLLAKYHFDHPHCLHYLAFRMPHLHNLHIRIPPPHRLLLLVLN